MRSRYVSSTSSTAPDCSASSTSACSDARSSIVPVGLCGHVTEIRRVDRGPHVLRDAFGVESPTVVEVQVDDVEIGADRTRRLEVGRVVRAHDHRVIARLEQRRSRSRTAPPRRPGVTITSSALQPVAARGDGFAQHRIAEVVAVTEQQVVERRTGARPEVETEVGEPAVGHRALGEIVGDRVVAELFGGLDLDGHSAVAHRVSLAGRVVPGGGVTGLVPAGCASRWAMRTYVRVRRFSAHDGDDPARRPRRVLRVGRAAGRPPAAGAAGHRGRRSRARRELRGQGVRGPHRDGRSCRRVGCARGRSSSSRASPRTPRRARPCSRCSRTRRRSSRGSRSTRRSSTSAGSRRVSGTPVEIATRLAPRGARARRARRSRSGSRARSSSPRWRARSPNPTACSSYRPTASSRSCTRSPSSGSGVSARSPREKLQRRGITTVGDVARLDETVLVAMLGRGLGPSSARARAQPRPAAGAHVGRRRGSIGSQHALGRIGPASKSPDAIDASLVALVDRVTRRMRAAVARRPHGRAAPALRRLHARDTIALAAARRPRTPRRSSRPHASSWPAAMPKIARDGLTLVGIAVAQPRRRRCRAARVAVRSRRVAARSTRRSTASATGSGRPR